MARLSIRRELWPGGEGRRLLDGGRQQLGRLEHLTHEAELAGLGGVDEAGPQHEVQRTGEAEHLHEQVVAALVGHQAEAQRAAAEARAVIDANRRSHASASDRPLCTAGAVDGGDGRLVDARRARLTACENVLTALYVDAASLWPPTIIGTLPGCSLV